MYNEKDRRQRKNLPFKKVDYAVFLAHDFRFLTEHYPDCLDGHRFYPFADSEIYWEAFDAADLVQFADIEADPRTAESLVMRAGSEIALSVGKVYNGAII